VNTYRTFRRAAGRSLRRVAPFTLGVALTVALAAALALPLRAQIIDVPMPNQSRRPLTITAAFGFLGSADRRDGQSGTTWFLGEAIQYKAMLDWGLRAGAIGLSGSIATQPIARSGPSVPPGSDGEIDLRQILATFRTRDQFTAHQVIEVSMGLAQWANYRGTDVLTDEEKEARNAFALVIGYGIGFPLGERATFVLVQEISTLWGSNEGLSAGQSRQTQNYVTRLGMRYRLRGDR
jgi:hypothetical protein